jgi:hypothetical protein
MGANAALGSTLTVFFTVEADSGTTGDDGDLSVALVALELLSLLSAIPLQAVDKTHEWSVWGYHAFYTFVDTAFCIVQRKLPEYSGGDFGPIVAYLLGTVGVIVTLSSRTKIFLYVKILLSFTDSQPEPFD